MLKKTVLTAERKLNVSERHTESLEFVEVVVHSIIDKHQHMHLKFNSILV